MYGRQRRRVVRLSVGIGIRLRLLRVVYRWGDRGRMRRSPVELSTILNVRRRVWVRSVRGGGWRGLVVRGRRATEDGFVRRGSFVGLYTRSQWPVHRRRERAGRGVGGEVVVKGQEDYGRWPPQRLVSRPPPRPFASPMNVSIQAIFLPFSLAGVLVKSIAGFVVLFLIFLRVSLTSSIARQAYQPQRGRRPTLQVCLTIATVGPPSYHPATLLHRFLIRCVRQRQKRVWLLRCSGIRFQTLSKKGAQRIFSVDFPVGTLRSQDTQATKIGSS